MTLDFRSSARSQELRSKWRRPHEGLARESLILLAFDLVAVALSTVVATRFRDAVGIFQQPYVAEYLTPVGTGIAVVWLGVLASFGAYKPKRTGAGTGEYVSVLNASLVTAGAVGILAYLLQWDLSRGFFVLLFLIGIPLLLVGRFAIRRFLHRARRAGRLMTPTLVAGSLDHIEDVLRVLQRERWLGYEVVGALPSDSYEDETASGVPIVGSPDDAVLALRETGASAVIFAEGSFPRATAFNRMARALEDQRARMIVVPALTDISAERVNVRPVAGLPLVDIERPRAERAGRWFKRAFDIVGSSLLILATSPIMAAVALAIKIGDRGPVMFRQVRVGIKGRPFHCLKFRSMCLDAEAKLKDLMAQNEGAGVLFKMKHDPRITPVGRIIRKLSLDELPQLFNVLKGDMSLVGPRPALPSEVERYEKHVRRRLDVRPGMTGLWQVSGRSNLSWDDTVRLDLYYVDNWSMLQDLAILFRTFGAVVESRGAS